MKITTPSVLDLLPDDRAQFADQPTVAALHLPGAGAETRFLFELADLAAFEAARREGDLHDGITDSSNTLTEAATIEGL